MAFISTATSLELMLPGFHTPGTRQLRATPTPCWNYSNQLVLNPLMLPLQLFLTEKNPCKPHQKNNKASCPCFPFLGLLSDPAHTLSGVLWYGLWIISNLSLQWQLSSDMLASLYPNNNKTYILKEPLIAKQFLITLHLTLCIWNICLNLNNACFQQE